MKIIALFFSLILLITISAFTFAFIREARDMRKLMKESEKNKPLDEDL